MPHLTSSIRQAAPALTARGFTIVELVVVVVLLGILASVALPRFISVSTEARVATLESLQGSLLEAASLANAQCRLIPDCNEPGFSTIFVTSPGGQSGRMYNGYPTANANPTLSHITHWLPISQFDVDTASVLFTDFEISGATDPDNCKARYRYAESIVAGSTVELFVGGC